MCHRHRKSPGSWPVQCPGLAAPTPETCWRREGLAAGLNRRHRKSGICLSCRRRVRTVFLFLHRAPHRLPPQRTDHVLPSNLEYPGYAPAARAAAQSWNLVLSIVQGASRCEHRVRLSEKHHSHAVVEEIPCLSVSTSDLIEPAQACALTRLVPTQSALSRLEFSGRNLVLPDLHSSVPGARRAGEPACC